MSAFETNKYNSMIFNKLAHPIFLNIKITKCLSLISFTENKQTNISLDLLEKHRRVTRRVQTNEDESQKNVGECKLIKKVFFGVSGGFPRWMFFNLRRFFPQKLRQMKKFVLHCSRCTLVTRSLF